MKITKEVKLEIIRMLSMKKLLGIEHVNEINFSMKLKDDCSLPKNIDELKEYVSQCSLCGLAKVKRIAFFDKGDISSSLYIVGLNYDFTNNQKFSLLENMIENVLNIPMNDVYMTNILKCTSSGMNGIYNDEVSLCMNYLQKQVAIGLPSIIITLGDAFRYINKSNENIIDVSGNLFSYNEIKLIPLMDPGFIYKNPSYKEKMFQDLQKIKKIMGEK